MCFLTSFCGYAQMNENTNLPSVLPVNPTAAEFLKYDQVPVSPYTGVPNISIPIYNIKAKGLDIPVSLTYHSNGIRVSEEAGFVGLGWSLNAGGSIVQVVRGMDDFGYYKYHLIPDFLDIESDIPESALGYTIYFGAADSDAHGDYKINSNYYNGQKDNEPDVFKFNFLSYSGEFILDWENEEFVCISDSKIKILSPNYTGSNTPSSFIICVPDGHRFYFVVGEKVQVVEDSGTSELYGGSLGTELAIHNEYSSRVFNLTQITTNKGDVVNFNYISTDEVFNYPNVSKQIQYFPSDGASDGSEVPSWVNTFDITRHINLTKQSFSYIESIEFTNGKLTFTNSDRIDNIGAKKLDKIELYDVSGVTDLLKEFTFEYDYFVGHTDGTNWDEYLEFDDDIGFDKTDTELTYRLKLLSVTETGKNPYSFEYNSEQLPKKTSLASDYWGIYNGYLYNENFFPNIYRFQLEMDDDKFEDYIENNNKSASSQYAKAGVLEKISYPTGGYAYFDYELNSFDNYYIPDEDSSVGEKEYVHLTTGDGSADPSSETAIIVEEGASVSIACSYLLSTRGCDDLGYTAAYEDTYIRIQRFSTDLIPYIEASSYGWQYAMNQLGIYGETPSDEDAYEEYIIDEEYIKMDASSDDESILGDIDYNFESGVVVFTVYGGCGTYNGTENSSQASCTINYRNYTTIDQDEYAGGGLRISNIYFNDGSQSIVKSYDYEGGELISPMVYFQTYKYQHEFHTGNSTDFSVSFMLNDKLILNSSSFTSPTSSNYVGYDKVTESNTINGVGYSVSNANGRIEYYYRNNSDATGYGDGYINNYVVMPGEENLPENGLLTKQLFYDSDGEKVKSVYNTYSAVKDYSQYYYGVKSALKETLLMDEIHMFNSFYNVYQFGAYCHTLTESSQVKYSQENIISGSDSITITTSYDYNDYNQLSYIKQIDSNSDIKESFLYYPADIDETFASNMIDNYVYNPLIKKEVQVNSNLVSIDKYLYKTQAYSSSSYSSDVFVLDTYSNSSESEEDLEDRVIYHLYDDNGNVLEVSKAEDVHIVYVWGYNLMYPVAKIENASYDDIESLSAFGSDFSLGDGGLSDAQETALRTDESLSDALVSTFTYDPLIGMTSQTDPNGRTTYYEYDDFGRLEYIRDQDYNIIKTMAYHYANSDDSSDSTGDSDTDVDDTDDDTDNSTTSTLELSVSSISVSANSSASVSVTSNTSWSVSNSGDWLKTSKSSGDENDTFLIIANDCSNYDSCTGTVTVTTTDGNASVKIYVYQED
jgi:YD repeat-containing protein